MEHNPLLPSQDPVSRRLEEIAHEPAELRPDVKNLHKQQLVSLAERLQKEGAERVQTVETPPRRTVWETLRLVFGGLGAGFALTFAVLFLVTNIRTTPSGGSSSIDALGRVLVPVAQANEAFEVYADPSAPKEADHSTILFHSKVALSADEVQRVLRVDTGRIETVARVSEGVFRVGIASVPSDQIIRVALPASVQASAPAEEGTPREYAWALQTTQALALVSSIPAHNANTVPLDASLELVLNAQGFTHVTTSIDITPAIEGRFETQGRRIVFIPSKPWTPSTLYTVRLKPGLEAEGLTFVEEVQMQFQTGDGTADSIQKPWLRTVEFQEAYVGDAVSIPVDRMEQLKRESTVSVTGYRLTEERAMEFLRTRIPQSYAFGSENQLGQYRSFATTEAFKVNASVLDPSGQGSELVSIPAFTEQGWYLIRLDSGAAEAWMFLQVTDIASYIIADKDQTVVWAVHADTKQPLTKLPVRIDEAEARLTDESGIARLATPKVVAEGNRSQDAVVALVRLGDASGSVRALQVIGPTLHGSFFERIAHAHERTWGYLYPDRPLYRTTDDMQVAGLLQDRESGKAPERGEIRLTKSAPFEDIVNGRERVYASALLTLDSAGRYAETLSWTQITPGYYQLDLLRDGELVVSRSIEVRSFVKPAYYLDVALSQKRAFAERDVQGQLKATFFSGAPVSRARLRVRVSQGRVTLPDQEVTLDEKGEFTLPLRTLPIACDMRLEEPCQNNEQFMIAVYPVQGEEAQILGVAMMDVLGSELDVRAELKEVNEQAEITIQAYRRDLGKELHDIGEVWPGRSVRGQIVGVWYEKIQDGVWYDAIEKRVVPYYRYERRQDPPVQFTVQTDQSGRVVHRFPMQAAREFYEIIIQGEDTSGRFSRVTTSVSRGWYTAQAGSEASLVLEGKGESRTVHIGERLVPTLRIGTSTVDVTQGSGVLFVTLSRGIREAVHVFSDGWGTTFTDALSPNATIRAVTFERGRFFLSDTVVFLDTEDRALDVEIQADKATYRPGEMATLRFQARAQAGQPELRDAKIAYAVVDESLLSLSGAYEENPLEYIYQYMADGMLFQRASHRGEWLFGGGGAEKGGGGTGDRGQGARRVFKDVAATGLVTLDAEGKGTVEVAFPDQLTSWRVTAIALASDVRAGMAKESLFVSKEVFVDVFMPTRVLSTDKPVLKLRAFGSGVREGEALTFTLDAPSLGITRFTATGTSGVPVYVGLPQVPPGRHMVAASVAQGAFMDQIERTIEIESTRITRHEVVTIEPTAGMAPSLPSLETTDLVISARGRAQLYPNLQAIAETQSMRADARVAKAVARELLHSVYGKEISPEGDTGWEMQVPEEGGIRLLPHGSSDVALSAQVALTNPNAVDAWQLRSYLGEKLLHGKTRLERLQAIAGLAALRVPVLLDLQYAATRSDLTPQEMLAVMEGLVAVGDTERAGTLMRSLLATSIVEGGARFIPIGSSSSPDTYEATALAAALAEQLLMPEAAQLHAFIETRGSSDAFPVLANVRYLASRLRHTPADQGVIEWTDGTRTETIDLQDKPFTTLALSPAQMGQFRILRVSGPVVLSYLRSVSGLPQKHASLSLTRRYEAEKPLDQLVEGDELTVHLAPRFAANALEGCAVVRDDLPAHLLPLSRTTVGTSEPLFLGSNTVSFIACTGDQTKEFSYRAKVTARGSYRAEPALIQRIDTPSIASYSEEQTFVVR